MLDDNKDYRDSLREMLESEPLLRTDIFKVYYDLAATDREALVLFEEKNHDIAIIDVQLDGQSEMQNGISVLGKMFERNNKLVSIILTGESFNLETARSAMECGARYFFEKGSHELLLPQSLIELVRSILLRRELQTQKTASLQAQIKLLAVQKKLLAEQKKKSEAAVEALVLALDSRDSYTTQHSKSVSELAYNIAKTAYEKEIIKLGKGFDAETKASLVRRAGLLHDIGKIAIPAKILLKQGKFIDEERNLMKIHPCESAKILEPIELSKEETLMIAHHHSWFKTNKKNAQSYPPKSKGVVVPVETWIISVSDVFDALTSNRRYRNGDSFKEAFRIIYEEDGALTDKGQKLHPKAVKAFFNCHYVLTHIKNKLTKFEDLYKETFNDVESEYERYSALVSAIH